MEPTNGNGQVWDGWERGQGAEDGLDEILASDGKMLAYGIIIGLLVYGGLCAKSFPHREDEISEKVAKHLHMTIEGTAMPNEVFESLVLLADSVLHSIIGKVDA